MSRVLIGLVKGLVVGGLVGGAMLRLGLNASVLAYIGCGLVGALVGIVCGRPPWRTETIWTPVVKALFGGAIGAGLCALGLHVLPGTNLASISGTDVHLNSGGLLAIAVGAIYGIFVEVDDGASASNPAKSLPPGKNVKR